MARDAALRGTNKRWEHVSYLFMRVPELVLEDGLAIGQGLDLIGKGVEGLGQRLGEM